MALEDLQLPPDGQTWFRDPVAGLAYARREFVDGLVGWVVPTLYGARLITGAGSDDHGIRGDTYGYNRYWCFNHGFPLGPIAAVTALAHWDGDGEPDGWTKNGQTGDTRDGVIA